MAKLQTTENLVKEILEKYPDARKDDYILYLHACSMSSEEDRTLKGDFLTFPFIDVMLGHDSYNLPNWHSVTRCRRRLQRKYPYLKDPEISIIREKEEKEYREYFHAN
jgi:hypothetical protein